MIVAKPNKFKSRLRLCQRCLDLTFTSPCPFFDLDLTLSALNLTLVLPWSCLDLPLMTFPWPCPDLVPLLILAWTCTDHGLTLPWPCLDPALSLPWPCLALALPLPCPCLDLALTLPWPCLDLALTLPLKFSPNRVSNSWDIPDMYKCC